MEVNRRQFSLMCAAAPVIGLQLPLQKKDLPLPKKVKSYEEFCHENHHKYTKTEGKASHILTCEQIGLNKVEGHFHYYQSPPSLVDVPEKHAFQSVPYKHAGDKVLHYGKIMLVRFVTEFHYDFNFMNCNDYVIPYTTSDSPRSYFSHALYFSSYWIHYERNNT